MSSSLSVADIFRRHGSAYRIRYGSQMAMAQKRAMRAIEVCRTAALGGHIERCDHCGHERIHYNSCRNRHCPQCQGLDKARWCQARQQELLATPYFHLVFTLPEALRPWAWAHQKPVYDLLFQAASQTLMELSRDRRYLGARIGMLTMLHTWSQTLTYHPHLHAIVTGGGLSEDGRYWVSGRRDFFLPVRVLSRLFRGKLLAGLQAAWEKGQLTRPPGTRPDLFQRLYAQEWVVYCKAPFAGPHRVLDYLARYTHRVALSNDRLVAFDEDTVVFGYRDAHQRSRTMGLPIEEFIRRFLQHVLPDRFVKIRYYGLWSNRQRHASLAHCRRLLGQRPPQRMEPLTWQQWLYKLTGVDPTRCPQCYQGSMIPCRILLPADQRAPP
ncbi:IS91 family transposase [Candidatus Bathyarchaeota archaeon]|jgi:hypothetical protein|nr:IS91 family transposase [Candidatus Bathyarchaeota archaeon]MBT7915757.1 IS91 family transposase [Candidatus Bathyarchaeota archaeon]